LIGISKNSVSTNSLKADVNMTLQKLKKGRSASELAREEAASIVALYREAQAQVDGKLYISYQDGAHLLNVLYADATDIETLLNYLQEFSETGYFDRDSDAHFYRCELLVLKSKYERKLKQLSREDAIARLAKECKLSKQTIARRLTEANKLLPKS